MLLGEDTNLSKNDNLRFFMRSAIDNDSRQVVGGLVQNVTCISDVSAVNGVTAKRHRCRL